MGHLRFALRNFFYGASVGSAYSSLIPSKRDRMEEKSDTVAKHTALHLWKYTRRRVIIRSGIKAHFSGKVMLVALFSLCGRFKQKHIRSVAKDWTVVCNNL